MRSFPLFLCILTIAVIYSRYEAFDPRDAGQLNFYLSAVDNLVKDVQDGPTIGLLLCKSKDI